MLVYSSFKLYPARRSGREPSILHWRKKGVLGEEDSRQWLLCVKNLGPRTCPNKGKLRLQKSANRTDWLGCFANLGSARNQQHITFGYPSFRTLVL